jgi:hypothetical protein
MSTFNSATRVAGKEGQRKEQKVESKGVVSYSFPLFQGYQRNH